MSPTDSGEVGRKTMTKADKEKIRPAVLEAAQINLTLLEAGNHSEMLSFLQFCIGSEPWLAFVGWFKQWFKLNVYIDSATVTHLHFFL